MFGEQTVLCGGSAELVRAAYDTLVNAGYAPELAFFECLHQLKLLVDLMHTRGPAGMYQAISNTAEYGAYRTGPRIIDAHVRTEMDRVLADIQSGKFAREWMAENASGQREFTAMRERAAAHPIEEIGRQSARPDAVVIESKRQKGDAVMRLGTPLSPSAVKVMLLGAGELGKEVIIELQRLGVETIAVDRYVNAPGQQVAHRAHVIDMTDARALRALVEQERPHFIVPEIEAIATDELVRIEADGLAAVIPTAFAAHTTMNRERIRKLAAEELKLPCSPYAFASSLRGIAASGRRASVFPVSSSR